MRTRSGLSDGWVVPSRGCGRQPGHGSGDEAGFSQQLPRDGSGGLSSAPRRLALTRQWLGASPRAHPRLGGTGSANSPAGRGAGRAVGSRSVAPRLLAEQMGPPRRAGASPQVCSRPTLI